MAEAERLGKEWYDSTAKEVVAMHASARTEFWPAKALEEATRREDEGLWSMGSVGASLEVALAEIRSTKKLGVRAPESHRKG